MNYQQRVNDWLIQCLGIEEAKNITSRTHRFLEEAVELAQATGCTALEAHELVDYVYSRPIGEPAQEVGGTLVVLAALCTALGIDMELAGEDQLKRAWSIIDKVQRKHANKIPGSPLPGA